MRQLKLGKNGSKTEFTNRDSRSVDSYLSDVSKEEMITPEEEVELAQRIRTGDKDALNKLVKANLRFAVSVAKKYQNQGLPLEDLIAEANVGLITAAENFDETKGFKFISYAVWWIRQAIMMGLTENARIVRLPLNKVTEINKVVRSISALEQILEREPAADEIAEEINLSTPKVKENILIDQKPASLDRPLTDDTESDLYEVLLSSDDLSFHTANLDNMDAQRRVVELIMESDLKLRDQQIMIDFGLGGNPVLTMEEVGEMHGLTRERIRQIREKALTELRNKIRTDKTLSAELKSYS